MFSIFKKKKNQYDVTGFCYTGAERPRRKNKVIIGAVSRTGS
jgi:hypothetical protein